MSQLKSSFSLKT